MFGVGMGGRVRRGEIEPQSYVGGWKRAEGLFSFQSVYIYFFFMSKRDREIAPQQSSRAMVSTPASPGGLWTRTGNLAGGLARQSTALPLYHRPPRM